MAQRIKRISTTKKILRMTSRTPLILFRNGFSHSLYLIYLYFVLPVIMKVLSTSLILYRAAWLLRQKYSADRQIRYWKSKKKDILEIGKKGYRLKIENFGLSQKGLELLREKRQGLSVVIAEVDHDGFLLSSFGAIEGVPTVKREQFLPRRRFTLEIVAVGQYVGVKKYYAGNKVAFVNEIQALHKLALAGCNVPAIMEVDFDSLTLTTSYIQGVVIREELAKKGAVLRDRDVDNDPAYTGLSTKQKRLKRIEQGKRFLHDVIDEKQIEDLFDQLRKIHKAGLILKDIKYGNIIIEKNSGRLYLIDFDYSRNYSCPGKNLFRLLQDRDIENFNLHFGTNKLTYERIRKRISKKDIPARNKWYAPVYFGSGLRIGLLWDLNVGYGRWHYILKHNIPSLSGKRILDLGANNASNALMMLINGASKAIGVELDNDHIEQGHFVKQAFEWADCKQYNLKYIHANMAEVPKMDLGKFDFVTALCSIYYLDDVSIVSLIQHISTLTDTFILQCNVGKGVGRADEYTYTKASVDYTVKALKSNGFPVVKVIAPRWYNRPLVIGKKQK